jgi:membrane protease YdiL (CAAX protease family)
VLGLRSQGVFRALAAGTLAFVATMPGMVGAMYVWTWLLEKSGHVAEPQEVAARFASLPADQVALPLFLGVCIQPLLEEVVFRSFLQPLLVQNFREVLGVGLTSVFFAAMHGPEVFLPIFALSCLLGAVKLRTQSLYTVWFLHALNNGITFAVLYAYPDAVRLGQGP